MSYNAEWIWINTAPGADEYGEFYDSFDWSAGAVSLTVSADSNYAVYLNGTLAACGQYADYPYDKVSDTVDLTPYCQNGKNHLAVLVWYYGIDTTQTYYKGNAGLWYALECDGRSLCRSSAATLSRLSPTYQNHRNKLITSQMGLGFAYDSTAEDGWMLGALQGFAQSVPVAQDLPLRPRPCKRLTRCESRVGKRVKDVAPNDVIFDLGINTVGLLTLSTTSKVPQNVTVSYGEHLSDGQVRRLIGKRDFSVEVRVKDGQTTYLNPFRRLGCRYIEIVSEAPLDALSVGLVPVTYPLQERPRPALTDAERAIYDACLHTLQLCMHEHYEDCPWREQALDTMDSRNQMLAGYYAFGETLFPKACLELISEDDRPDGLLSICYPIKRNMAIPSFSLHFITECEEYLKYSADEEFIRRIHPKIEKTLDTFLAKLDTVGLIPPFSGVDMWNFYEWEDGLEGYLGAERKKLETYEYDLALNTLLSIAISRMISINDRLGLDSTALKEKKAALNQAIYSHFYKKEKGLFETRRGTDHYSKLTNALSILAGVPSAEESRYIAKKLTTDDRLVDASLSMRTFLYDALLAVDKSYASFVISDIERVYTPMLKTGNNTVWETELGESDFSNAGSLCHGWSSIPIYYYNILK